VTGFFLAPARRSDCVGYFRHECRGSGPDSPNSLPDGKHNFHPLWHARHPDVSSDRRDVLALKNMPEIKTSAILMQRIPFGHIRSFAELVDQRGVHGSIAKIGCAASRRHYAYSVARG
jgi:hypothetical protein